MVKGGIVTRMTQVTVARDFSVAYYNNYKVVKNSKANETYVLYQCGVPKPKAGDPGIPAGAKFFEIPLVNVIVAETVPFGFLVPRPPSPLLFNTAVLFSTQGSARYFASFLSFPPSFPSTSASTLGLCTSRSHSVL